jgi:hypothetical protein
VTGFIDYLQIVTIELSLIPTFYKSLEHKMSSQPAFTSRFLVMDLNNGDSSASVLTSLLSGEYPTPDSFKKVKVTLRWRFTANQFVLVPSPLRLMTSDYFNGILAVIVLI